MLEVLYEDNHIIAVNKKISDIVQADKTGDTPLSEEVKAYIKKKYNKPGEVYLGIPHRVDRPVSGVVIFARTSKALTRLNKMFQEHEKEISKIYWAIVGNLPAEDHAVLTHYLMRDPEKNKSHAYIPVIALTLSLIPELFASFIAKVVVREEADKFTTLLPARSEALHGPASPNPVPIG